MIRINNLQKNFGTKKAVAVVIDKNCNCIDAMLGALYAGD